MAINNFKPFALDPNANVTSQADWEALPALLSGFTAGKASSAQVNKAIRQASFIAAALAQYTANKSGLDVLDDGDLNGFISKMGTAFGKDFQALDATLTALAGLTTGANKLPYFTGNDTAAQTDLTSVGRDIIGKNTITDILTYLGLGDALIGDACKIAGFDSSNVNAPYMRFARTNTVVRLATKDYAQPKDQTLTDLSGKDQAKLRTYLDLKSAAQRDVGSGANQIPDMNDFTSSLASPGWQKLPSGLIIQWGTANPSSTGEIFITFPVAFSAYPMYVGFGPQQVSLPNVVQSPVISAPTITNLGCGVRNLMIPTAGGAPVASMSSFFWIAVGK
ncbi:TPA: hypothetical protein HJO75_003381 [Escherichia coli]|nr:hypothetical protein [Escherichia coli]HAJ7290118.1 hypothetical protein [Escherichia coli]HAJ8658806.1 hypothetical protein [Escherichia coli]HBA4197614.1 hypothetical protein [Escherichia coli]HBA4262589.1 hypothetical protein [Escherichia coli]